jgi:hypothetical protein
MLEEGYSHRKRISSSEEKVPACLIVERKQRGNLLWLDTKQRCSCIRCIYALSRKSKGDN